MEIEKTKEAYNKMFMDMHNKYCLYFMDFTDGRSSLGMNGYIISYNEDFEITIEAVDKAIKEQVEKYTKDGR